MFRIVHPKDLRRTQNTVPRAALRFALGYLIMPLWGWGPRWSIAVICKRVTAPFYKKNEIKRMHRPFLGSMDPAVGGASYNQLAPVCF
jgi:hypothetical protein